MTTTQAKCWNFFVAKYGVLTDTFRYHKNETEADHSYSVEMWTLNKYVTRNVLQCLNPDL